MPFTLPPLPYDHAALEPAIDAQTMQIHHGKHHQAYVTNANKALEGSKWADAPVEAVVTQIADLPEAIRGPVRNNAGGHFNHSLFWTIMAPAGKGGGGEPNGPLADAITKKFGGFSAFKDEFAKAAAGRFGSGWAWLCAKNGGVAICSTANQDNPLMGESIAGCGGTPILGLDVWEHAYYLKYQNRRPDYVTAWWGVVNWGQVAKNFAAAK
ncbi:MAG: superoxide dismutase [Phycisphaeraceae bacterium]|nr:superoxide dismutase [Phycisphaeraceae bacterium]